MTGYRRDVLVDVVIHHGRTSIKGCHCGWAKLGRSHAEHVADVYEATLAATGPAAGGDRYAGLTELSRNELVERLAAAEDVCALLGWTASSTDTAPDKALHELWAHWAHLAPSSPKDYPHLTPEFLDELARRRDATRAATLARLVADDQATQPGEREDES